MMNNQKPGDQSANQQRRQLEDSEKKAAAQQPENFKDDETADKVVEIGPEMTDEPIKGIDPDEKKRQHPPKK